MTKNTFIGYLFTGFIVAAILIFFLIVFGKLPLPIIHIGTVLILTSFAFPVKKGLKGIRLLDEREKMLALKTLSISTYVLLITLLFIASFTEVTVLGHKLSEIWGHFVIPIFLIILSIVGYTILWFEERG